MFIRSYAQGYAVRQPCHTSCALNYHVHLTAFLNGSDHAEYTRKSQLTEDESKRHKNNKGLCERK